MINKAKIFAYTAHAEQKYGNESYSVHLDDVVSILKSIEHTETDIVLGYLHDTVEDTAVTLDDIRVTFDDFIAHCVRFLTDEKGKNCKERKAKTNLKLSGIARNIEDMGYRTVLKVKTADRLANVRKCVSTGNFDLQKMYKREHPAFKEAVYRSGICDELWTELDSLLKI